MTSKFGIIKACWIAIFIQMIGCTVTPLEFPVVETGGFEGICFETEILPLFVSKCGNAGCHNATDKADDIDLTTYNEIRKSLKPGDPSGSEVVKVLYETGEDLMPPPPADPLTEVKRQLIEDWITDGAQYTTACNNTSCDLTVEISFTNQILPIIDVYCLGCHNTKDPQGGYSYTTYEETLKSVNDGTLLGSVQFVSGYVAMPINSAQMPECNVDLISTWVQQGAKNN